GLIGYGSIAKKVADTAKTLGMDVLVYDPFISKTEDSISLVDKNYLLKHADFVSLHAVLNESTKNMIVHKELELMKNTAWLINSGRGELIQEDALHESLVKNRIKGAALDVFATEPNITNNPLIRLNNVISTPHVAGWSSRVYKE